VGQFVEEFFGERVLGGQISKFGDIYKISHANIKFLKNVPPRINIRPALAVMVYITGRKETRDFFAGNV
jgi:hypothetical protein